MSEASPTYDPHGLSLWVVFARPGDFPNHVVVREQRVGPGGIAHAPIACLYTSLEEARVDRRGYTWLDRDPNDDPAIVGVWL